MFKISAFGDEIDNDIEEQARVLQEEGIKYLELRVWGDVTLPELPREELDRMKRVLNDHGLHVSDIASPIGKSMITDDFDEQFALFKTYVSLAEFFETRMVRVFSYYCAQDKPPEDFGSEVIERMRRKTDYASRRNITLIMENERWLYGNIGARCREILESVNSPHLRLAFDPQNFLAESEKPFDENFEILSNYIAHVHIKDGKLNEPDTFLFAGEGDGQLRQILGALKKRNYQGFLSLEPHLGIFGGADRKARTTLFREAHAALKKLVREVQAETQT